MALLTAAARISVALALGMSFSAPTLSDAPVPTGATTEQIRTLLHLNGSEEITAQLGGAMGQAVIGELRKQFPTLSPHAETAISNTVEVYVREQGATGAVIDLLVPIYAKNLTESDVEKLIAFYRSPVGKKLASVTPAISFESTRAGQQWAASIATGLQAKILETLRKENVVK